MIPDRMLLNPKILKAFVSIYSQYMKEEYLMSIKGRRRNLNQILPLLAKL